MKKRNQSITVKPTEVKQDIVYDVMYPSTHDITPNTLEPSIAVLRSILQKGKTVLIVSKPHVECVEAMVRELAPWKAQIMFRFTIGCMDNALLSFWEPGATTFEDRLQSLRIAYENGFRTSVSVEPILDMDNVEALVNILKLYVTDKIWIGVMKAPRARVRVKTEEDSRMLEMLIESQTPKRVKALYDILSTYSVLCWKDTTRDILDKQLAWKESIRKTVNPDEADTEKTKATGTKEWAKKNLNICIGCSNNCRYCYARQMSMDRFHRTDKWEEEIIRWDKVAEFTKRAA